MTDKYSNLTDDDQLVQFFSDVLARREALEPGPLFPGTRAPAVPGHEKYARPF